MTTILAIDSSVGISSVAVWRNQKLAVFLEDKEPAMQAARLVNMVEAALNQAGIDYSDLSHVAATTGPGSFTGIRIGLATARAIAFAAEIPCLGFTTLEVMHEAGGELCIINAGKEEVYFQYFGKTATAPSIGLLADIIKKYPDATIASSVKLPQGNSAIAAHYPRADALAKLAAKNQAQKQAQTTENPLPFYIRPPDAKIMSQGNAKDK